MSSNPRRDEAVPGRAGQFEYRTLTIFSKLPPVVDMTPIDVPDWLRDDIAAAGVVGHWIARHGIDATPDLTGAYVLALRLDTVADLALPRILQRQLSPGWYVYLGNARGGGGIHARLARHFRREKKLHWHVDRLTVVATKMAALAVADGSECDLVARFLCSRRFRVAAARFGSSDCRRCDSHLLAAIAP